MKLWILLTMISLAECRYQKRDAHPCPDLCSCSFPPSGVEVVCSQGSLSHFPVNLLPSNATRLSIQSAGLSSVAASHLSAAPLLSHLQLYHTNLTGLPADLLKNVPHLETLDLTGNKLLHLPSDVFSHASLRSLVLRNNRMENADADWFPDNSSLTWLDLSGNRLTDVPAALLHKLPNLENLDLSDNGLLELQPDALRNLRRLETLNLAGNKLTSLSPSIFAHSPRLSRLFLQENQLRELPAGLLRGLRDLELLLLNQNRLRRLPSGLLDGGKSSLQVSLAGNPWACDKRMEHLWEWLVAHRQNVLFPSEVACAAPEDLKGRPVVSLSGSEIQRQSGGSDQEEV